MGNGEVRGGVELGRLLVGFRVDRGLSQEGLADRSGISVRAIRELERGRVEHPRHTSIALLADALALTDAERAVVKKMAIELHRRGDGRVEGWPDPTRRVPCQLPPDIEDFTGRDLALERLHCGVRSRRRGSAAVVITAAVGKAGVGKTTLVRLLTRVLEPASGEIRLDGAPLRRLAPAELARRVGVVPQGALPQFPFTVGELVLMGRYPHGPGRYFESPRDRDVAREAMDATGVLELAELPFDHLSGGERQRAVIARGLAQEPRLLVLDEPTAHLDLRHQVETAALLRRLNRERGMTIVLVSHDLNLAAEVCDRLLLLAAGRTAAIGAPEAVLDEALLASISARVEPALTFSVPSRLKGFPRPLATAWQ